MFSMPATKGNGSSINACYKWINDTGYPMVLYLQQSFYYKYPYIF